MEAEILSLIDFNLFIPTSIQFLNLFKITFGLDLKIEKLSLLILELFLLESELQSYLSSEIVYATLCFVSLLIDKHFKC